MANLSAYHNGQWRAVDVVGYGGPDGLRTVEVLNAPLEKATFYDGPTIHFVGEGFNPSVSGGSVVWKDADTGEVVATGGSPTINYGGLANDTHSIILSATDLSQVKVLNLGFDSSQDAGDYSIGSSYNYPTQNATGIEGINKLINLLYFCCNNTGFTGPVDFTGMSHLQYIECYTANVTSVNLNGCSSLIRLCLEQSALNFLDLNPVSSTLRDLRAAAQSGTNGALEFATINNQMNVLYHYCVRDQPVINHIPLSKMPSIRQRWDWNTSYNGTMTNFEAPTSINSLLGSWATYNNSYTQQQLDSILIGLDTSVPNPAYASLSIAGTGSQPSSTGLAAEASMISKGWTVDEDWPN